MYSEKHKKLAQQDIASRWLPGWSKFYDINTGKFRSKKRNQQVFLAEIKQGDLLVPSGKILNPRTNRFVTQSGRAAKKMLKTAVLVNKIVTSVVRRTFFDGRLVEHNLNLVTPSSDLSKVGVFFSKLIDPTKRQAFLIKLMYTGGQWRSIKTFTIEINDMDIAGVIDALPHQILNSQKKTGSDEALKGAEFDTIRIVIAEAK